MSYRDECDDYAKEHYEKRREAEKARLEAISVEERAEILWKDYVQRTLSKVR